MQPRTRKILGVVLPVLFAGFVAVIAFSWSSRQPEARSGELEEVGTPEDPAELISYEFEDTQLDGERVVTRVRARRTVGFESGWYTLEDAYLTFYRRDGGTYSLGAPRAQLNAKSKEARAEGGVRVGSSDGLQLQTAAIHFDGRRLTNEIPVDFEMGEWSGRANGVDIDVDEDVVNFHGGLALTLQTAEGPVQMFAPEGVFRQQTAETELRGGVRVIRANDRSFADTLVVQLDRDQTRLVGMEGEGNVRVELASDTNLPSASRARLEGEKTIEADRFRVALDGEGVVRRIIAGSESGRPVQAALAGETLRSLSADTMTVSLIDGRVAGVEAAGNARVVERGPARRTIESNRVNINIAPASGQARLVLFEGDVRLTDQQTRASASRAVYEIAEDLVTLTSDPGSAPSIETAEHSIRAEVIELEPERNVLRARGRVVASLAPRNEMALFDDAREPVFVNAKTMVVRQNDDYAAFSDDVRVWQSGNTLFADQVQLLNGGATITARGDVRAILSDIGPETGTEAIEVNAGELTVHRGRNRIELDEDVRVTQQGRTMTADQAVALLDSSNRIREVIATGAVEVRERATGRSAKGDRAVYDVLARKIAVEGSPAKVTDASGSLSGSRINFDLVNNRVQVERGDSPTEATYNANSVSEDPDNR